MKTGKKVGAVVSAGLLLAGTAPAEIKLNDALKLDGFIDMSATYLKQDGADKKTMSFDQWETDFYYTGISNVTGRVDINDVTANDKGVVVEQAFFVVDLQNGLKAKAGKFLTPLGWEGAEPTLLYQYSVSATIIGYPGYANGLALTYDYEKLSFYGSVVDGSFSGDKDAKHVSYEGQVKFTPIKDLTLQAGYAEEKFDPSTTTDDAGVETTVDGYTKSFLNFWAEYHLGDLLLAAEYNVLGDIQGPGSDGYGYLFTAHYQMGKFGITGRHSKVDLDNGYEDTEFTISPSYQVAANLLTLLEYRHDDYGDKNADTFAAEATFTF
jgi:hypothetical protein